MITDKQRVLELLQKEPMTEYEINQRLVISSGWQRISELRKEGYEIVPVKQKNSKGSKLVLRGKKCSQNEKPSAPVGIGPATTTKEQGSAVGITAVAASLLPEEKPKTPDITRWYGYRCAKGHIDHYYGPNPPETMPCAFCSWQEQGKLIT